MRAAYPDVHCKARRLWAAGLYITNRGFWVWTVQLIGHSTASNVHRTLVHMSRTERNRQRTLKHLTNTDGLIYSKNVIK